MDSDDIEVFQKAKLSFENYPAYVERVVLSPFSEGLNTLFPPYEQLLASKLVRHQQQLEEAVAVNAEVCRIVSAAGGVKPAAHIASLTTYDELAVTSVLRQFAREWSEDGVLEREVAYGRIKNALTRLYPSQKSRADVSVIVPGCGLGRLPYELSLLGFNAVGNEFSAHMVLASQAILNSGFEKGQLKIYPYIHSHSHWRMRKDPLRSVQIPDVCFDDPQAGTMSMGVGDFFDMVYKEENSQSFQAIATCFFIDAPFNFLKTLDALTAIVEVGGIWVNFGPLHWHSEMSSIPEGETPGIELSLEDVLDSMAHKGWVILERESSIKSTYCSTHPERMGRMLFDCEFWIAKRLF